MNYRSNRNANQRKYKYLKVVRGTPTPHEEPWVFPDEATAKPWLFWLVLAFYTGLIGGIVLTCVFR
jgi:hypothetical protein